MGWPFFFFFATILSTVFPIWFLIFSVLSIVILKNYRKWFVTMAASLHIDTNFVYYIIATYTLFKSLGF